MERINDSRLLGYAFEALKAAELRLDRLQQEFPNFAVQLNQVRAPMQLDIKHLKDKMKW